MYFEKCISNYNNKKLIKLSQLKRNLMRNLNTENHLDIALEYYNAFADLLNSNFSITKHPLFEWSDKNSTSFLFEKINLQDIIAAQYTRIATKSQPVEAKKNYAKAMSFNLKSLEDLNRYLWEDPDTRILPVLQENYHYYKMFQNASEYYYSIYQFCIQNEKEESLFPIRRAYHYKTFANVWKKTNAEKYKSLTLLEMAKKMEDEKTGEKLALIQNYKQTQECGEYYTKWEQQNNCVYYDVIETTRTIKPFTLKEAFLDLSKILSPSESSQTS